MGYGMQRNEKKSATQAYARVADCQSQIHPHDTEPYIGVT